MTLVNLVSCLLKSFNFTSKKKKLSELYQEYKNSNNLKLKKILWLSYNYIYYLNNYRKLPKTNKNKINQIKKINNFIMKNFHNKIKRDDDIDFINDTFVKLNIV